MTVMFLDACCELDVERNRPRRPLSASSETGRLLREVVALANRPFRAKVVYASVIPRTLLDPTGSERKPTRQEMMAGLVMHPLWRLTPKDIVVALEADVHEAVDLAGRLRTQRGTPPVARLISMLSPGRAIRCERSKDDYVAEMRRILETAAKREIEA